MDMNTLMKKTKETHPPFGKAFCDKLKIVFHVHDLSGGVAKQIDRVLRDLLTAKPIIGVPAATRIAHQAKAYRHRYRVPLNDRGDALIIELRPNRPDHTCWAMTWEYNPSHLTKEERKAFITLTRTILGSSAQRLLDRAAVYEPHTAIDFPVELADVAIENRDKSACGAWGKSFAAGGRLQTQYFGSSASDAHDIAYDKRDEILAALASKPGVTLRAVADKAAKGKPRLRLENRQRLSRCPVPLHRLDDLREPFAGFHIYSFDTARDVLTDNLGRTVLALAQAVGLQAALGTLDKRGRETIRSALAETLVEWCDDRVYAQAIEQVVKDSCLLSDRAFDRSDKFIRDAERWYRERLNQVQARRKKAQAANRYFDDLVPDAEGSEDDQ